MDRLLKRSRSLLYYCIVGQPVQDFSPGGDEFVHLFETRFPNLALPQFCRGRIGKAIHEAGVKKQPLLLYLHDTTRPALIEKFVTHTLCNPEIIPYLVSSSHSLI